MVFHAFHIYLYCLYTEFGNSLNSQQTYLNFNQYEMDLGSKVIIAGNGRNTGNRAVALSLFRAPSRTPLN